MSDSASVDQVIEEIRTVRQARQYRPDPVPREVLDQLLEIARWTGSSRNTQPWHLIVVTDKALLRQLSEIRTPINWMAEAPLAIAIVLDGGSPHSEAYDEGRMTERLLIAAKLLGLGGGTAWYGDEAQVADAPLAIAIVLDGASPHSEAYDEGRMSERLLIAAKLLGLGGGTAWYGDEAQVAEGKRLLGIPEERTARSLVVLGYPTTTVDPRPNRVAGGRKPLAEIVSDHRYGEPLA